MLLGVKSGKIIFLRYFFVGVISALLFYLVWILNSTWSPDMRLWKAFGGVTFTLLFFTVFIGPAGRLWSPLVRIITWRRETGVWFTVMALVHAYLVLDGWVRWGAWELLGYKYIPEIEMYLRSEPGFGLANLMGLLAVFFATILATTSFDKVVSFLSISSWKWLHVFSYVIFYLIAFHVIYFAFIHYSPSPERILLRQPINYPENPLRFYYLTAIFSVFIVQILAFIKTVYRQRKFAK